MKTNYGKILLYLSIGINILMILTIIEYLTGSEPSFLLLILKAFTTITLATIISDHVYKQINKNLKND